MVALLKNATGIKPSEFYGRSLPRPRIFTNPKFNPERVDPPVPVTDPLLSWAKEAHWSMGGLSFQRLRLQGRIEGKISRLRAQREKSSPKAGKEPAPRLLDEEREEPEKNKKTVGSVSPPAAPVAVKRRKLLKLNGDSDDDNDAEGAEVGSVRTRRKLWDDFNRVADESGRDGKGFDEQVKKFTSKGKVMNESSKDSAQRATRSSPRLAKRRLS